MKLKTKEEILETIKKYEKLEFYQVDLKELPDLKDLKIVGDDIDEKIINFLDKVIIHTMLEKVEY